MNWRKNKLLIISTVVLLVVGVGVVWMVKGPELTTKKTSAYFGNQIDKFCVNEICLQKTGDNWMVSNGQYSVPANSELAESYVTKFKDLKLGDMLSVNQENFVNLGIGVSQVVLKINGKSLEIGNANSNYDGTYVREADGKTVYNLDLILEKSHLAETDIWINKILTNLPTSQIDKITITNSKNSRVFVQKEGKWEDQKWVDKAAGLTAVKLLTDFTPGTETKIVITIDKGVQNTQLILGETIKPKNTPVYWATTDSNYYYSITPEDFNLLTGKI